MPYKVLFFSHDAKLAGAEISLCQFVAGLDRSRFSPLVVVPQRGPLEELITQNGVPYVYIPYFTTMVKELTDPVILKQIIALREAILSVAPDLIVINTVTIPQAIVAALTTDIPIVVQLHEFLDKAQFPPLPASTRLFEEIWLQFPETLLADSYWTAQRYHSLLSREVHVIPNFVMLPVPSPVPDVPLVAMIASLDDKNKRPDLFINVAAMLRKQHPELMFHCTLYGNGKPDAVEKLNKQIIENHLGNFFTIHPRVKDVETIYRSSTVVFVASEVESFSMVVIEAGAYQRPVVATRCGGPDDLIIDGETGFLIDVGDSNAAAERLAFLLKDPEVVQRMGTAARLHVEAHFSPHSVLPCYESLLEDTLLNRSLNAVQRRIASPIARYFMGLSR